MLTLIRVLERKILPSSIKRYRKYKITIYCDGEYVKKIEEVAFNTVDRLYDFSAKKLIENTEKSKVSITFEHHRKKVMKNVYNKLCEICSADAVTIQELND